MEEITENWERTTERRNRGEERKTGRGRAGRPTCGRAVLHVT